MQSGKKIKTSCGLSQHKKTQKFDCRWYFLVKFESETCPGNIQKWRYLISNGQEELPLWSSQKEVYIVHIVSVSIFIMYLFHLLIVMIRLLVKLPSNLVTSLCLSLWNGCLFQAWIKQDWNLWTWWPYCI